jgi:hypothetical protein
MVQHAYMVRGDYTHEGRVISAVKPVITKPARVVTPQCCVDIDDTIRLQQWRQDRYKRLRPKFDPLLCQHESTVEIDGKHYCTGHGGKVALCKWLKGELVEKKA